MIRRESVGVYVLFVVSRRPDYLEECMTPEFGNWFKEYQTLQQERERGTAGDLWKRVHALGSQLECLAVGNLYERSLAAALLALERACIRYEERDFVGARQELEGAKLSMSMSGEIDRYVKAHRKLIEGNIYLVQEQFDHAALHYEQAKVITGDMAAAIRANAAFNLGVIYINTGEFEAARNEFEFAKRVYESSGLSNKVADCLHQLGLIFRQTDETLEQAFQNFMAALNYYVQADDLPGQWRVCDDLARLWLIWSDCTDDPVQQSEYLNRAMACSTLAAISATQLWNIHGTTEGRLADLSDQLLYHTMTHCEVCIVNDNILHLLGTLAVCKGRIRAVNQETPPEALAREDSELLAALKNDDPRAILALVLKSIPRLNQSGETIAVIDQLGLLDDRLVSGVMVLGDDPCYEFIRSNLHSSDKTKIRRSIRGRNRCQDVEVIVSRLIQSIRSHSTRCSMLLSTDVEPTSSSQRIQLAQWASELNGDLQTLGRWFFPDNLMQMLRELDVTHVVLVSDPLFGSVPYAALQTVEGTVVDQPWSLSQVTSTTELLRLAYRPVHQSSERSMLWMGPDTDVNSTRGGNAEFEELSEIYSVEECREQDATLAKACSALGDGRWVHFRGHGVWKGDVAKSGPVFSNGEILDRTALDSVKHNLAGFLVTVACYTGFSTAVGSEAFGSLVDYDRAGLQGALLTRWPIIGSAATPFMRRFYTSLHETGHVAKALQKAARKTRDAAPHPYFWAPFVALGAWETKPR